MKGRVFAMNGADDRTILLEDDFTSYPACERMDAYSKSEAFGPWLQTTLHFAWKSERIKGYRDCTLSWRLVDIDGRRFLEQPEYFFNSVLAAGDPDWRDYALEVDLAVSDKAAGPIVRYHTSRRNYWIAFEPGQPLKLIRRDQEDHITLGVAADFTAEKDRVYRCKVECEGARIAVSVDGAERIRVEDEQYARGRIALRSEGPSRFAAVKVTARQSEAAALAALRQSREARFAFLQNRAPKAKPIHSVSLPFDPSYINLYDLNGDGRLEILAVEAETPRLDYMRMSRMAVLDWDGNPLWSIGEHRDSPYQVHGDIAFNIADIDGDGRAEILLTHDFEILILDGATGEIKRRAPTPLSFLGRESEYERTVGDSILVCNLRGLGGARDFILKDRYRNMWAYTGDLRPLWHRHVNTGHYPRACDIDGDGKDEVMAGYSLLKPDGATLWTVPGGDPEYNSKPKSQHADSMLLERFGPEDEKAPIRIAMAASDLGFVLLDTEGRLLAHHWVGHAQSLGASRFRPDLPGRQFAVLNFWGNCGIVSLFDCEGNPLLIREPVEYPLARPVPVNWQGDGGALMLGGGALLNGHLEPVVALPGSGASKRIKPPACDVNGDGIDELVFQGPANTLQIYAPEFVPADPYRFPQRELTNWNGYGGFYL